MLEMSSSSLFCPISAHLELETQKLLRAGVSAKSMWSKVTWKCLQGPNRSLRQAEFKPWWAGSEQCLN